MNKDLWEEYKQAHYKDWEWAEKLNSELIDNPYLGGFPSLPPNLIEIPRPTMEGFMDWQLDKEKQ